MPTLKQTHCRPENISKVRGQLLKSHPQEDSGTLSQTPVDDFFDSVSRVSHLQRVLGNYATAGIIQAKSKNSPIANPAPVKNVKPVQGKNVNPTEPEEEDLEEILQGKAVAQFQWNPDPPAPGAGDSKASIKPRPDRAEGFHLPAGLEQGMNRVFKADFSEVSIFRNSNRAREIGALAYTQGTEIHFAPGEYNPDSSSGRSLLGHELTHVVQQSEGKVKPTNTIQGLPLNVHPSLEREADRLGSLLACETGQTTSQSLTTRSSHAALETAPLLKSGHPAVMQAAFSGYHGGGWLGDNSPLPPPLLLNNYLGGPNGNNIVAGQQAGATGTRQVIMDQRCNYNAPGQLGGFNTFSLTVASLFRDRGRAAFQRYTHLHVINGKMHGPGTPDNLILGSQHDNQQHQTQVEDYVRDAVPAPGGGQAIAYQNAMQNNFKAGTHPFPNPVYPNHIFWNNPNTVVVGSAPIPLGAGFLFAATHFVNLGDAVHTSNDSQPGNPGRWLHYKVEPLYTPNRIPPQINQNLIDMINEIFINWNNLKGWIGAAFPHTLRCDALEYRPAFGFGLKMWFKRLEAQTDVPINQ